MDKIGAEGVEAELLEKGMPEGAIMALTDFISQGSEITLDAVAAKCADASIADELKYIIATVEKAAAEKYKIQYTPNLVRGQGYYTGVVFEIGSPDFSGAVGGGGRYDNLIGKFIGQQIPAVGFSIGFERICGILLEKNYKIPGAKEKCALLYDDAVDFPLVLSEAAKLRADFSVAIIKKAKKPGPQYDMLEKQGYTKFATFKDGALTVK
jgi:histidyl-tRNA synthetase